MLFLTIYYDSKVLYRRESPFQLASHFGPQFVCDLFGLMNCIPISKIMKLLEGRYSLYTQLNWFDFWPFIFYNCQNICMVIIGYLNYDSLKDSITATDKISYKNRLCMFLITLVGDLNSFQSSI